MLGLTLNILRGSGFGVSGGSGGPGSGYTPPLDAYSNTVVAYSIRKLSSTYTGPCMQIRRASDGATQDIGFDGDGLVHTSDIISFCSGSVGTVSIWYDQGSLSQNATQSDPAKQPVFYSGTDFYYLGEYPYVRATGSQQFDFSVSHTGDWTNLTIIASTSTSNTGWTYGASGGAGRGSINPDNTGVSLYYGAISTIAGSSLTQNLYSLFFDNTGIDWFRNGLGNTGVGSGVSGFSWDTFMSRRVNDSSRMAMQEWITWSSDLISDKQTLESNLNSYYQVTNLPDYTSGFLADYPDAAVAYSVRQLSNTAIKCMRVRRFVAPFDEQDIGFTADGDLDEAAIVAFGGSDELRVSKWYDQSGQQNHAEQDIRSNQPQIYNGSAVITENGKPAVKPTDATQLFDFTIAASLAGATFFTVSRAVNGTATSTLINGSSAGSYVGAQSDGSTSSIVDQNSGNVSYRLDEASATFADRNALHDALATGNHLFNFYSDKGLAFASYIGYNNTSVWMYQLQEFIAYRSDEFTSGNLSGIETNISTYFSTP